MREWRLGARGTHNSSLQLTMAAGGSVQDVVDAGC